MTIAVLDTGIYAEHEALRSYSAKNFSAKIVGWYDAFFPENLTPYDMDLKGHGTHVASIAAAHNLFNGTAPGANLVAINIYNLTISGPDATDESVERAINWTVENRLTYRIRVASMSFGRDPFLSESDPLTNIVTRLVEVGVVVVVSAGNEGTHGEKSITAPGDNPYAITVGAIDDGDAVYSLSGQGPTRQGNSKPDVVAPGVRIEAAGVASPTANSTLTGTSMAVPHVSGAVAILLQANATLTPAQVKMFLCATAYKTRNNGQLSDNIEGYGKIQIQSALEALQMKWDLESWPTVTYDLAKQETSVWARQVCLKPSQIYSIRAVGANGGKASVTVFQMTPDSFGRPHLIATNIGSHLNRIAFQVQESQDALIVVKLNPGSIDDTFVIELLEDPLYLGLVCFAIGSTAWGITTVLAWVKLNSHKKTIVRKKRSLFI
ncbi:MAG: putative proteinase [Promethearchaeota archaeon CR_4]|nr:MAG: putative proteinase [Candidatus Lokiarchaeota archaeon CR_4]